MRFIAIIIGFILGVVGGGLLSERMAAFGDTLQGTWPVLMIYAGFIINAFPEFFTK